MPCSTIIFKHPKYDDSHGLVLLYSCYGRPSKHSSVSSHKAMLRVPFRDDTMDCHSMHHVIRSQVQTVQSFNYSTRPSIGDRRWLIIACLISWKHRVALHLGLSLAPIVLFQCTAHHHLYINEQHFSNGVRHFIYDPFSSLECVAQAGWQFSTENAKHWKDELRDFDSGSSLVT